MRTVLPLLGLRAHNDDRWSLFNHYSECMREFKNVEDKMGTIASKSWSTTVPYT